jgi:hypothetical protein
MSSGLAQAVITAYLGFGKDTHPNKLTKNQLKWISQRLSLSAILNEIKHPHVILTHRDPDLHAKIIKLLDSGHQVVTELMIDIHTKPHRGVISPLQSETSCKVGAILLSYNSCAQMYRVRLISSTSNFQHEYVWVSPEFIISPNLSGDFAYFIKK